MNQQQFVEWIFLGEWKVVDGDLFGEIMPIVTEKNEFDYRDKSIILNIFQTFWTIGIMMEGSELLSFQSIHPP